MANKLQLVPPPLEPATIDRCAYLILRENEAKPWLKELATIKSALRKHCETRAADQPVRLLGVTSYVDLTAREEERKIVDNWKAFKALRKIVGIVELVTRLTITFKVLDREITEAGQAKYVTKARTGSRDVTAGLRDIPEALAA